MSHVTCIPDAVFRYPEFKAQPPWFRLAVFTLANALSEYGEGSLSDAGLRGECGLGPKPWLQVLEQLIAWKWIERDSAGRLRRAGLLLPPSRDALRMRSQRQCAQKEEAEDRSARIGSEPQRKLRFSEPAVHANTMRTDSERSVRFAFTPSDISDSESDSDIRSDIYISESESESESDIRSDSDSYKSDIRSDSESDQNLILNAGARTPDAHRATTLPPELAREASFKRLFAEGVSVPALIEAAERMRECKVELWKEKYLRKVVWQIMAERRQERPALADFGPQNCDVIQGGQQARIAEYSRQ